MELEDLFAHEAWLKRLAASLAPGAGDDLVQEAWLAAMRKPPEREVRPWLARVVRNLARMRHRTETRRAARERAVVAEAAASPETLVANLEAHQRLGALVLGLAPEQRAVILLSFGEGLTSAEIARRLGVPAGTVRWRLKTAIDELRTGMGVERPRRSGLLLGFLGKGLAVAKTSKVAIALVVLLLLAFVVGRRWIASSPASSERPRAAAPAAPRSSAEPAQAAPSTPAWMTVAGARPRRIAGRVLRESPAVPIQGARVRLTSDRTAAGIAPILEQVTGPDGTFDFGPQLAARYTVTAAAIDRQPATREVDLRGPLAKARADALVLTLGPCTARIFGEVSDSDGAPLPGARLAFDGETVITTTSDDGAYELCLGKATMGLTASAEGLAPARAALDDKDRQRVDFTLTTGTTVTCEVLDVEDGTPVAGAIVSAFASGVARMTSAKLHGVTDANGRVQFEGVLAGTFRFGVIGDGVVTAELQEVRIEAGTARKVEILVERAARVRGTVRDERGAPVAGALISGRADRSYLADDDAVTQEDGSFLLGWVPRGAVKLRVEGYQVLAPLELTVAGDVSGLEVRVGTGRRISGRVVSGGVPIEGADLVAMTDLYDRKTLSSATSDEKGAFEIRGLDPDVYHLYARKKVDDAIRTRRLDKIDVRNGDVTDVQLELSGVGTIEGILVDEGGSPVPGAAVAWRGGDIERTDFTDSAGAFRAEFVKAGLTYAAEVRLDGAVMTPAVAYPTATIGENQKSATGLRLVIRRHGTAIAGQVVDEHGMGVAGALVQVPSTTGYGAPATADDTGAFRFETVSAGAHELVARSPDGTRRARVSGVTSGRTDVKIVLGAGAAITGRVTGFKVVPEVRVQELTPPYNMLAPTVTAGRFEVAGLYPGPYAVTAQAAGEQAAVRLKVAPGERRDLELTSQGSATVTGTATDLITGTPVTTATCRVTPRAGEIILVGAGAAAVTARTNDRGMFELVTPAGDIRVGCFARGYASGSAEVTVGKDQTAQVQITMLAPSKGGDPGLKLSMWSARPRVLGVDEGGAAAAAGIQAGDVITAVDGTSVLGLDPAVVAALLCRGASGSSVAITTDRGTFHITLR